MYLPTHGVQEKMVSSGRPAAAVKTAPVQSAVAQYISEKGSVKGLQ
jgi:hypothetical protein